MRKMMRGLSMVGLAFPVIFAGAAQAQRYGPNGPPVAQYDSSQGNGYYQGGAYPPPGNYGPPRPPSAPDMAGQLRTRLQLRADQDGALNAFVQAVTPPPGMNTRMQQDQVAARTMTTPQRLDLMVSNMDQMRQLMLTRVQATKLFYAQLSPAQQRAFDAMGAQSNQGGMGGPGGGAYQGHMEPPGGPNAPVASGGLARN